MDFLAESKAGGIGVLVSPRTGEDAGYKSLLKLTATLALQEKGTVRVLDCGNRFDVYQIARLIRRQTPLLTETLNQISVARAFTCYQVVTLFEQIPVTDEPKIVIDLLATFYDENVSLQEGHRLLNIVLGRLDEMRPLAPILISVYPPPQPERNSMVRVLCNAADHVLIHEPPPTYYAQPLF
ncbi:MAG: hypothetical protein WAM60_15240 [Candidatus Promineifilaceae bacterium]